MIFSKRFIHHSLFFAVFAVVITNSSTWARTSSPGIRAGVPPAEQVQKFVDSFRYADLASMQIAGLMSSALETSPWSDHYWGHLMGGLAQRYADTQFPLSNDWKNNADYLLNTLFKKPVEILSPAEKYDLLVGDNEARLTRFMLQQGRTIYEKEGEVEGWLGYCHGWSAASMVLPRPTKTIVLTAADGVTRIPFYPADIKALASALWAQAIYEVRQIGQFCEVENGDLDGSGRITNPECFDVNPATWHLAIVNQIGHSKRSLVMDAKYNREIWNQPVLSYSYQYFSPLTGKLSTDLRASQVPIAQFYNDRFRSYRSPQAKYVVGIAMDIVYVDESQPTQRPTDSEAEDATFGIRYYYDLELDGAGAIIGGEWHQERHADLLWVPFQNTRPQSIADALLPLEPWQGTTAFPKAWTLSAQYASNYGQPLARVVETLFALSSQ